MSPSQDSFLYKEKEDCFNFLSINFLKKDSVDLKGNTLTLWACLTRLVWLISQCHNKPGVNTLFSCVVFQLWDYILEAVRYPTPCPDQLNWSQLTLCCYYQGMFQGFGWPCGSWEREGCTLKPAWATDFPSCKWCPWYLLHFIECFHYSRSYACRLLHGRYWTSTHFPTSCIVSP